MNITYRQNGDYLIPNIVIRLFSPLDFVLVSLLCSAGFPLQVVLMKPVLEIEEAAQHRIDTILPEIVKRYGITEELKAENQMLWVGKMNMCKAQAEEIVKLELIYD